MKFRSKDEAPTAYPDKLLVLDVSSWRHQRPVLDKPKCSHCAMCLFFCPTGCITCDNGDFVVNLDFCKGCGICAKLCSRSAITMIREVAK
jgi:2-oxoacid:acceptor oxidoreductase delta subunit (pyruvate/2-ketoisovalerate family)